MMPPTNLSGTSTAKCRGRCPPSTRRERSRRSRGVVAAMRRRQAGFDGYRVPRVPRHVPHRGADTYALVWVPNPPIEPGLACSGRRDEAASAETPLWARVAGRSDHAELRNRTTHASRRVDRRVASRDPSSTSTRRVPSRGLGLVSATTGEVRRRASARPGSERLPVIGSRIPAAGRRRPTSTRTEGRSLGTTPLRRRRWSDPRGSRPRPPELSEPPRSRRPSFSAWAQHPGGRMHTQWERGCIRRSCRRPSAPATWRSRP